MPNTLGALPLGQAVVLLAKSCLKEARSKARTLSRRDDAESLHDLRVALRRLDTLLRSHAFECDGVKTDELCRRIRKLARRSNHARDSAVQHVWLLGQGKGLKANQRTGYRWLLEQLQPQVDEQVREGLLRGVKRLRRTLRQPLRRLEQCAGPAFAQATAHQIEVIGIELLQSMASIENATDMQHAHSTRIQTKRLRYLLFPLRDEVAECEAANKALQQLQDLLGEMHDRQVMHQWLRQCLTQLAAQRAAELFDEAQKGGGGLRTTAWQPPHAAGVLAMAVRNRVALEQCFDKLQTEFISRPEVLAGRLRSAVLQLETSVAA